MAATRPRVSLVLRSAIEGQYTNHNWAAAARRLSSGGPHEKPVQVFLPTALPLFPSTLARVMLKSSTAIYRLSTIQRHLTMNAQELKNFLAESVTLPGSYYPSV
jgi:hypothetical protein